MTDKDREAFEEMLQTMNIQADEFGHYYMDEGNLYWLWGRAEQAATERAKERERELVKALRDIRVYSKASLQGYLHPVNQDPRLHAMQIADKTLKQYEESEAE
jgi:hypothetical protein